VFRKAWEHQSYPDFLVRMPQRLSEPRVISESSVHSPFSFIVSTDLVVSGPKTKPQVMDLSWSSSFSSVSRNRPSIAMVVGTNQSDLRRRMNSEAAWGSRAPRRETI
jgi:hypothetical protein